jgi:hypothetical protein
MPHRGHNNLQLAGKKFDYLTAIEPSHRDRRGSIYWKCRCVCGKEKNVMGTKLRRGGIKSCGCMRFQLIRDALWKGFGDISGAYWRNLQDGATRRGIEFSISIQDAWELFGKQGGACALTGVKLIFSRGIHVPGQTASLDRIENSRGYVAGNVQWVHKRINRIKGILSQQEFQQWCLVVTAKLLADTGQTLDEAISVGARVQRRPSRRSHKEHQCSV